MDIKHGDILKRTHTNVKDNTFTIDYFKVEKNKRAGFTLFLCDESGNIFNRDSYDNKHYGEGHGFIQDEEWKWEVIK